MISLMGVEGLCCTTLYDLFIGQIRVADVLAFCQTERQSHVQQSLCLTKGYIPSQVRANKEGRPA